MWVGPIQQKFKLSWPYYALCDLILVGWDKPLNKETVTAKLSY